jgi:O-Antigen ligase
MVPVHLQPETTEEHLVYWTIVLTWVFWLLGALYVVSPFLGWALLALGISTKINGLASVKPVPVTTQVVLGVWVVGGLAMLLALLIGHANFSLGLEQTIKSVIGWIKGWALLVVFLLSGTLLNVRPHLIYRATNILALQTLCLVPIFLIAKYIGLPKYLYVSPLYMLGGPGPEFFNVELYSQDPMSGALRWRFFSPWCPAAGMVAIFSFIFAACDRSLLWKSIGLTSAIAVCVMSQSRLAIIGLPLVGLLVLFLSNITKPVALASAALVLFLVVLTADQIVEAYEIAKSIFENSRADSSFVRTTLQSIAQHRWWTEAPIWGHGVVERGSHLVQYMPIGSHHTWNGLLYVKGIVGFTALAIPLTLTFLDLFAKAQADKVTRAAFAVTLVIVMYCFGENLEILVYLIWPALFFIGLALKRPFRSPFRAQPFVCAAQAS